MIPSRSHWAHLTIAVLAMSSAMSADTSIHASEYPAEALELADALAPELADSIKTCSVEKATSVHERVQDFIYKQWSWNANYEKLKPYRVCFQMLSNIAATSRLITNRFSSVRPHAVAGSFDANYAACRKLADPTFQLKGVSGNAKWPARFGPDPGGKPCG